MLPLYTQILRIQVLILLVMLFTRTFDLPIPRSSQGMWLGSSDLSDCSLPSYPILWLWFLVSFLKRSSLTQQGWDEAIKLKRFNSIIKADQKWLSLGKKKKRAPDMAAAGVKPCPWAPVCNCHSSTAPLPVPALELVPLYFLKPNNLWDESWSIENNKLVHI